ncbi:MAG: hypothetical protein K8L99_34780 [Anaerolineae bacterium]|nr:hypothetical protein [Anaerolineae bacterium]
MINQDSPLKRKRKSLRNILILLGITIAILGMMSAVALYIFAEAVKGVGEWVSYDGGCLSWWGGPDDPAAIETGAHLSLPSSTENLFAHSVAFQDCFVFVSFTMVATDLDPFLASTYVSELESVTGSQLGTFTSLLGSDVDWHFVDERTYLYGEGSSNLGGVSQYIAIEVMSPMLYKVYVVTFLM